MEAIMKKSIVFVIFFGLFFMGCTENNIPLGLVNETNVSNESSEAENQLEDPMDPYTMEEHSDEDQQDEQSSSEESSQGQEESSDDQEEDPIPDSSSEEESDCVVPVDNLILTEDTTLCPGTYYIEDLHSIEDKEFWWMDEGILIINTSDVTLDCNGATIITTDSPTTTYSELYPTAISVVGNIDDGLENVHIKDCNLQGFFIGIHIYNKDNTNSPHSENSIIRQEYLDYSSHINSIHIENVDLNEGIYGVKTDSATNVQISGSSILDNSQNCMYASNSPNLLIEENTMRSDSLCLLIVAVSDGTKLYGNTIYAGWSAVSIDLGGNEIINNKLIYEGNEDHITGIYVSSYTCRIGDKPSQDIIQGNQIENFYRGIWVSFLKTMDMNQSFITDYELENTFTNVDKPVFTSQTNSAQSICK